MSQRLRLALFLAALAATGPMPSAQVVEASRVQVGIAWLCGERAATVEARHSHNAVTIVPAPAHRGFNAHPAPVFSPVLLPHSLFQRPPPLQI